MVRRRVVIDCRIGIDESLLKKNADGYIPCDECGKPSVTECDEPECGKNLCPDCVFTLDGDFHYCEEHQR